MSASGKVSILFCCTFNYRHTVKPLLDIQSNYSKIEIVLLNIKEKNADNFIKVNFCIVFQKIVQGEDFYRGQMDTCLPKKHDNKGKDYLLDFTSIINKTNST